MVRDKDSSAHPAPGSAEAASDSGARKTSCPSCGQERMRRFYRVSNIPAHSVLLMPSAERAVDYPRRDLELAFCPDCGFVANTLFDPGVHEYSPNCEESQGCSPTFGAFASGLARRWVEDYRLRDRTVLEIGCGKGEFLLEMIRQGMSSGIGIDPAYVPGRLEDPLISRLQFIQDLYDERYAHLQADVICCRHTLEHIAPTRVFMEMLRRSIAGRDTLLLFELPDVRRVLDEAAFWDIYYEHCSYFTAGSLARLFRGTGFEVIELTVEYGGQYILLAARPARSREQPLLAGENDLASVAHAVDAFPARVAAATDQWRTRIDALHARGRKIVLWGGGSKAVSFLTTLGLKEQIDHVIDINPHKQGRFIPGTGHGVRGPHTLSTTRPDVIVLMNPVYRQEVGEMVAGMGLTPEFLLV